jgi:hypothetical protein
MDVTGDEGLDSSIRLPCVKSCSPDELENQAQDICKSPSPHITQQASTCTSEGDLEFGQYIEIDKAVEHFYKGAFPILRNTPCDNQAQLIKNPGNADQNVPVSNGNPMPTLLDKHHRWWSEQLR